MADSFIGKDVTVRFEVTEVVAWRGTVIADDEKGILLRRPYRKGLRLELIPRDQIRGVFHEEEKGPRRKQGANTDPVEEPESDDFNNSDEPDADFESEPNTNWDDDDD